MAKKPTKDTPKTDRAGTEFIGFVNINLNDEELSLVDAAVAAADDADLPGNIDYLLDLGKLSLNYTRGSMNVTLTVLEGTSAGYAVSGYSDTLQEALFIVRMKVQNYLSEFPEIYKSGGTKKRRG